MCQLCDRNWLSMYNSRWGDKYILHDYTRKYGTWKPHYNRRFDPYMKRFKRNIGFNPKEDLKRNMELKYW